MDKAERYDIKYLFEPESIAVIGTSHDKNKVGYSIFNNIISGGYKGKIFPVNPRGGDIDGHQVFTDILKIESSIDCASIVIPANQVRELVKNCAQKKVKFLQIITSGFSEIGNIREEKEIVEIAKEAGMRILGPNIFGLYSSAVSLNSTFSATKIRPGHVAILTQSGALGISMIGKTAVAGMGLSSIVSIGNKCDIDEADLLEYFIKNDNTKVIFIYIEGVKKGERLIEVLKASTAKKPVIAIKSGRSKRGAQAAASHTGSLAGSDQIFDAVIKQCGVLRAECLEDAFNWCKFMISANAPKSYNSVIITNGGGIGVMATDACEKHGVPLFDDQTVLKNIYDAITPSFGSTKNPIDLTGTADAADYTSALSVTAESKEIGSTIGLYCETATFDSHKLAQMIADSHTKHQKNGKPISYALVGGELVENTINSLKTDRISVFNDVEEAVSCMGAYYRYYKYLAEPHGKFDEYEIDTESINKIIDDALKDGRTSLLANEGEAVMRAADIAIPQSRIARSINEAVKFAGEIGYPVVMKVVSKDILHKSDVGGILLNLDDEKEVVIGYEAIIHNCRQYRPNAVIEGIEVAEMLKQGLELIVGARRDPSFGPVIMCGLGGIYVEVMKDISFRALPINRNIALSMLEEIRSYPLLLGVRGEEKKDIESVIDTIIKICSIIKKCERITDIEINPLFVYNVKNGIKALDARILISKPKEDAQ
ncbi:MAG: acetate--CoA ligase family protein [Syntrophaceae bacterium]|nr:acetate--CoA ligase family protein [Syntrophaceae bacterium]